MKTGWLRRRGVPAGPPGQVALGLAAITIVSLSCGATDSATGPGPPGESAATLRLPVRVHLLSSRLSPIDASFTSADVASLFQRVNEVWAQADIVWDVESILTEPAEAEDPFEMAIRGAIPLTTELLVAIVPSGRLFSGKWDVFIVRDLASAIGAPGIFIPSVPLVMSSEVDPAGLGDPGRILAHELGHSLTLEHVACTLEGNLMAPGCDSMDRTRLSVSQIDQARAQAQLGGPTRS